MFEAIIKSATVIAAYEASRYVLEGFPEWTILGQSLAILLTGLAWLYILDVVAYQS